MNTAKRMVETQFDLTKITLNNLSQYDITPTAKLVLLYLTDCYNPKHADVFPKQKTIADKLGISERSVVRAVQELFKAGLILIECKHTNRYILMPNMTAQPPQVENLASLKRQNDIFTSDNLSPSYIEQKRVTKKEQHDKGGNVYNGEEKILREYAIKHGAKCIDAYVRKLKQTNSAENIICEYKKQKNYTQMALRRIEVTQKRIAEQKEWIKTASDPQDCAAWVEFGKKIGIKKIL